MVDKMNKITYRKLKKYKYQIIEDYKVTIPIQPDNNIVSVFIELDTDGNLTIKAKYAWDGPSGPTIDTKNFMRGSLVHDALYQLIRENPQFIEKRNEADQLLRQHCIEDGMSRFRAGVVYRGVKWFGKKSALPVDEEKILYFAP